MLKLIIAAAAIVLLTSCATADNGQGVDSVDEFEEAVAGFESGDRIRLRVLNAQGYRVVVLRLKD